MKNIITLVLLFVVAYSCKKESVVNTTNETIFTTKNGVNNNLNHKDAELIRLIKSDISDIELGSRLLDEVPFSENVTRALINRKNMDENVLEVCLVSNEKMSNQIILEMINKNISSDIIEKVLMISGIDKNMEQVLKKKMPNLNIESIKQVGKEKTASICLCSKTIVFSNGYEVKTLENGNVQTTFFDFVEVPFAINTPNEDIESLASWCNSNRWQCGGVVRTEDSGSGGGSPIREVECGQQMNRKCVKLGPILEHPVDL